MSRPQFWLVAGPNGAGKSTMSATIKKRFPSVQIIDPDYIAKDMTGSFSSVDQERIPAGRQTLLLVKQHIEEGKSFVVESTISGSSYIKYAKQARNVGFRTTLVYVGISSAKLSASRVSKRVSLGGHAIPTSDIERRHPRSLGNLEAHIKAFESAHIYDNSKRYQWVADYREGIIHKTSQTAPQWIKQYLP